ncbi:MAG: type II toxin-antitoxin system HicB family antitoxin [Chloroflexia bacterium]
MKHRYLVIVEKGENNYSAYAPDVSGCVTVGDTLEETLSNMREALELHFECMQDDGDPIPQPYSVHAAFVEFKVPATVRARS